MQMQRQNVKRSPFKGSNKLLKRNKLSRLPVLLPAYPGQVTKKFVLEGTPILLTTTVTTGVIASATGSSSAAIANFATRFGATFEEYRIVRIAYTIKCFASTNPGLFVHWIDEKQVAAPTLAEAQQKSSKSFPASSPMPHTLTWTANDPLDLQFQDIGTAVNSCAYKIYTDNANFGSSIVATAYAQIFPVFHVQFRGYN
jgi:hypothetical protein